MVKKENCCGCEACYNVCSMDAIRMIQDEEGFFYPNISGDQCTACSKCVEVCPVIHMVEKKNHFLKAYACYNRNEAIRAQSTSGGAFSAIAEYFINEKQGVVFGVKFDDQFDVVYDMAEKIEELAAFRGSKYVQCRIKSVFSKIKYLLENKRNVLFTGLPCQVEGLLSYLGKDYTGLYTVDMVCFGVASPFIWQKYLDSFHERNKIEEIVFKDKTCGWKNWRVKIIEDKKATYFAGKENLYMNSYLQRINIRPACYQCEFKGLYRTCDFTISDCWGVGELNERLNDDKGLSALLVHTWKAQELFECIKGNLRYEEYRPEELMEGNWAITNQLTENQRRAPFFHELKSCDFKKTFLKYFKN